MTKGDCPNNQGVSKGMGHWAWHGFDFFFGPGLLRKKKLKKRKPWVHGGRV